MTRTVTDDHGGVRKGKLRRRACRITHVHYSGSGQSILPFLANRNTDMTVPPSIHSHD